MLVPQGSPGQRHRQPHSRQLLVLLRLRGRRRVPRLDPVDVWANHRDQPQREVPGPVVPPGQEGVRACGHRRLRARLQARPGLLWHHRRRRDLARLGGEGLRQVLQMLRQHRVGPVLVRFALLVRRWLRKLLAASAQDAGEDERLVALADGLEGREQQRHRPGHWRGHRRGRERPGPGPSVASVAKVHGVVLPGDLRGGPRCRGERLDPRPQLLVVGRERDPGPR
mmetsp:Transcript_95877/g.268432  ORF Transcript_95877/g.268432 Transcript_95877/m.268432 type:complete len:225 (+) Transcript_95877:1178-1852(+)